MPEPLILVVDDDASILETVSSILAMEGYAVETATNGREALEKLGHKRPFLVLLDMRMPGKGGLTWLEEGKWPWPLLPVIIMTGHGTVDACRRAFRNGVFEFFTKPLDADKLIETVGLAFEESQRRFAGWQETSRVKARFAQLTAREHEVLGELMKGLSNKEVAARLNLSPRTVEAHRAAAFTKLGVGSLVQAIREYDKLQSV